MRRQFSQAMVKRANANMVFFTGDLGFMALEPVQETLGNQFINAGVAEQNMMSVAAGMAYTGLDIWVYSIAPFCYARPFEQIRNDIAFHNLPVKLVGNGGGYGYGVMGPTHHAIEDYGVLCALPNMQVCVPIFDEDLELAVNWLDQHVSPAYLRLGLGQKPEGYIPDAFAPWRQLTSGQGPVVIAFGPLAGSYLEMLQSMEEAIRPNLWAATVLPLILAEPPAALLDQISKSQKLVIAEEHVQAGSFGSAMLGWLAERGKVPQAFTHLYARAHAYDTYGSQPFMRKKSYLDPQSLLEAVS